MALEISTVGAKVMYKQSSSTTRPTSGYSELKNVSEAPEFDMSLEVLDASNITDAVTRYIPGRQDPGGDKEFTLNHVSDANEIETWQELVGSIVWFEYQFPNSTKSFFWSGIPRDLGSNGISQNEVSKIPAHVAVTAVEGWQNKSTQPAST